MFVYRLLLCLAAPYFALKLWRGAPEGAMQQRLGGDGGGARAGAVFWLHAASNGELTAARPLIETLLTRDPRLSLVVTCNSDSGRALVESWGLGRVSARLAPLDYRLTLRRFIANWQPDALILVESELWPNRMVTMNELSRPVVIVSARMSEKSAAFWRRLPGLARRVMGTISFLSAQDAASEARFVTLGLSDAQIGEAQNLKLQGRKGTFDKAEKTRLSGVFTRDKTMLAASTHEGEETLLIRGFKEAQAQQPGLKLILAPRHPRRSAEIRALLAGHDMRFATRSLGEEPDAQTQVYLADTLGEMPLWYELAATTFVGGSLVTRGGHTPLEPAAHGSALLHGPHLDNFAEVYAALQENGASVRITGSAELAHALLSLSAADRAEMAARANRVIAGLQGDAGLTAIADKIADLTRGVALQAPGQSS